MSFEFKTSEGRQSPNIYNERRHRSTSRYSQTITALCFITHYILFLLSSSTLSNFCNSVKNVIMFMPQFSILTLELAHLQCLQHQKTKMIVTLLSPLKRYDHYTNMWRILQFSLLSSYLINMIEICVYIYISNFRAKHKMGDSNSF